MKALGIINFSGHHIRVEGMQDYRPIGAFLSSEDIAPLTFQFPI